MIDKLDFTFDVYSDTAAEATRALRLAWRVDEMTQEVLKNYGIDLKEASGEDHGYLPVPATILFDEDGKVLFQHADPNYQLRLPVSVMMAAAKAYAPS